MRIYLTIAAISSLLLLANCFQRDPSLELQKTIFIPDSQFPQLPIYSEWGYNTFGAFYNTSVFVADYRTPAVITTGAEATTFTLQGVARNNMANTYPSLIFSLPQFEPDKYQDAIQLNDRTIDLTQSPMWIVIERDTTSIVVSKGTFQLKRAQSVRVDLAPTNVILSGYFDLIGTVNGTPITFTNGRFDVSIGDYNFYKL